MNRRIWILSGILAAVVILWPLPASVRSGASDSTRILDRNGVLLYDVRDSERGVRDSIALSDVPTATLDALLSAEDRGFYYHWGLSPTGILRAMYLNLSEGSVVAGGSTITQQLVRNLLRPESRGVLYKMYEAFVAVKIEERWSKDKILSTYINTVYFGRDSYGLSAAAKAYFGKDARQLSIGESAYLIGLLKAPIGYDPVKNPELAKTRKKIVLQSMLRDEKISREQYESAAAEPVVLVSFKSDIAAPHFSLWVRDQSIASTDIRTTLDSTLQKSVESIIEKKLDDLKDKNVTSAAVVVLDAKNGDILSMVGSADYFDAEHEGAVNVALASRQPGSALKPFTYALALQKGMTAATTFDDVTTQFWTKEGTPYVPRNYDFEEHGLVRMREALANSYNIAAVKALEKVGVSPLLQFLKASGISTLNLSPEHYGLALTLGSGEVKLLELAQAYGIFARGGKFLSVRSTLEQKMDENPKQVLDPKIAWLITDILSDNDARIPEFGSDSPLRLPFPVAAKTGTTRNSRDNWTVGYTPQRIVGVWVGNADNSPMKGTSGVTGAGPIFHDVMEAAMANVPKLDFARPQGIIDREICVLSGKKPTELCTNTMTEHFIQGSEPKEEDDIYQSIAIDTRNNLLATDECSPQFVRRMTFTVFPPDVRQWARENGFKVPPTQVSPLCGGSIDQADEPLEITRPNQGDSFQLDPIRPDQFEKVIFEARASGKVSSVDWYVNGKLVGKGSAPSYRFEWAPTVGTHTLDAKAAGISDRIVFEVVNSD